MLIIGIAGGSGSGKTTVVRKLMGILPTDKVTVIPQDNYYKDNSHISLADRKNLNFDHPSSIDFELLVQHLDQLKRGESINMPQYSYLTCTRAEETIPVVPTQVLIIEGIMILVDEAVRKRLGIKVFVDANADDRLMRIIHRDMMERGRGVDEVLDRYQKTVQPMHAQFIEPTKRFADIIIPHGGKNEIAIDMLTSSIQMKLMTNN